MRRRDGSKHSSYNCSRRSAVSALAYVKGLPERKAAQIGSRGVKICENKGDLWMFRGTVVPSGHARRRTNFVIIEVTIGADLIQRRIPGRMLT
jgi:hypothetical protein